MKRIIIFSLLLAFTATSFGQQSTTQQSDYLQKSKKQKTGAWILTGVGAGVLILTAMVSPYTNAIADIAETNSVNIIPFVLGGACVAGGIVLFIASSRNKKMAESLTAFFRMEKVPVYQQTVFRNQSVPALGVRISL